jgi:colicin import membrane protein
MTDRPAIAFMLSATLHGVVIGILFLLSYAANQRLRDMPRVLELVAGEGDNYGAKVAPKLGTPDALKIDVPAPPTPKAAPIIAEPPEPPAPPVAKAPPPEPAPPPVAKTPPPVPVKAKEPSTVPNFEKQIRRKVIVAESKAKLEIARARRAEEKRIADEKKKARMTKAEFDKQNKTKAAAPTTAPRKVAKIDTDGIAKGVVGGSAENKVGGVGGKALTSDNDDVMAAYFAVFKQRLTQAFEAPPGLSDTLEVTIQARSHADGSIDGARVVESSGSAEFDRAVLAAMSRTQMGARPDGRTELFKFSFSMRDRAR